MSVIREVFHVISGGPELFEQFRRESCFGHLIDFTEGNSCNNALHALLSREFGGSDFDPSASHQISRRSFYSRELHKTPLRVKDLLERFRTYSLGDDLMDYVMVANVLFLHTMIFGYDQTHMIDDWVWVLAEDRDRWNSFPWGAYAFSLLTHYMSLVPSTEVELRRKFKKMEEKARLSYHF
ncbi:hypothetical protein C2S51_005046 [Perilla frutescens var. frutescens]|nr:hypothetical protein C2S51_005046 [Perilla frutescens var. frutescens]